MGWIGCVHCEKSRCDFVAQTFALIAPVHPVLHRVSCSYEMIPNAPKHNEMHQNMSLGSNGVDQVVRCENYNVNYNVVLIAPVQYVLQQVSCSYETIQNAPKHNGTHQNMSLGSNRLDQVRWLRKITMRLRGTNFCINWNQFSMFSNKFHAVTERTQIIRNAPKH